MVNIKDIVQQAIQECALSSSSCADNHDGLFFEEKAFSFLANWLKSCDSYEGGEMCQQFSFAPEEL